MFQSAQKEREDMGWAYAESRYKRKLNTKIKPCSVENTPRIDESQRSKIKNKKYPANVVLINKET